MLVSTDMRAIGILVHQSKAGADNLIISTAFQHSNATLGLYIVSKNKDVLIYLFHQEPSGELLIMVNPHSSGMEPKFVDINIPQMSSGTLKEWLFWPMASQVRTQYQQHTTEISILHDSYWETDAIEGMSVFYQKYASLVEITVATCRWAHLFPLVWCRILCLIKHYSVLQDEENDCQAISDKCH